VQRNTDSVNVFEYVKPIVVVVPVIIPVTVPIVDSVVVDLLNQAIKILNNGGK